MILCDDRDDPVPTFEDYRAEYDREVAEYPLLGAYRRAAPRSAATRASPPAGVTEQLGDVRVTGTAPILVVGTTRDPATPFAGARGPRHPARGLPAAHLRQHRAHRVLEEPRASTPRSTRYLLRGTLPAEGTVCTA